MVNSISVEVIAPVLTDLRHYAHCEVIFGQTEVGQQVHREELDEYPQDLKEDFARLSAWLIELAHGYGDALRIKLIAPQSFEGFLKSVRYWVRRCPAFIIAGRKEYVGWDKAALDRVLRAYISGENPTDESQEFIRGAGLWRAPSWLLTERALSPGANEV